MPIAYYTKTKCSTVEQSIINNQTINNRTINNRTTNNRTINNRTMCKSAMSHVSHYITVQRALQENALKIYSYAYNHEFMNMQQPNLSVCRLGMIGILCPNVNMIADKLKDKHE